MRERDLPNILAIENATYDFPWTRQIFQDCLRIGYRAWVLEQDRKVTGYGLMTVGAGEAHLLNLCIHPNYQRCGYGRCLLEHLLKLAKHEAVDTLFLEVRPSNQAAIQLYTQVGFNQVGIRRGYYPSGNNAREDAIILAIAL
ncbi:MAG: ribosomal-protein-alanine N-acetyltransferase [Beggiatoa sp. IS2]|nr:MAG: ribosomal-protein-alanine N-acetyltransferase [Beggiatoa sp. IS2]